MGAFSYEVLALLLAAKELLIKICKKKWIIFINKRRTMESGAGIITAINFLGNLCVVIITIATFYLTIISNKLSVTSVRESFSRFYGTEIFSK